MANPNIKVNQDPGSPDNQVDPKWTSQMDSLQRNIVEGISRAIRPGVSVVERQTDTEDHTDWCTAEEAARYNTMVDKDFLEIDPKTRKPVDPKTFHRVIHWFPDYQTANTNEFKGRFAIEKWQSALDGTGAKYRKVLRNMSDHVMAKEFLRTHIPTIPDIEDTESK